MKKIIALILSLTLLVCLCACSDKGNTEDENDGFKGEFLIGGLFKSGSNAAKGAALAVEQINSNGGIDGINFALEAKEIENDEKACLKAYKEIYSKQPCALIDGTFSALSEKLTVETSEDALFHIITFGGFADGKLTDNAFRLCYSNAVEGRRMAGYCIEKLGLKTASVLFEAGNADSEETALAFEEHFVSLGGTISLKAEYPAGTSDFGTQLSEIKAADAQCLFLPIGAESAAAFAKAAAKAGLKTVMLGAEDWNGITETVLSGEKQSVVLGSSYLSPYQPDSTASNVAAFVSAYKSANNGETPDLAAAYAYDAVYLIKSALEKAGMPIEGKIDSSKLQFIMPGLSLYGITGVTYYDATNEPNRPVKIVHIGGEAAS